MFSKEYLRNLRDTQSIKTVHIVPFVDETDEEVEEKKFIFLMKGGLISSFTTYVKEGDDFLSSSLANLPFSSLNYVDVVNDSSCILSLLDLYIFLPLPYSEREIKSIVMSYNQTSDKIMVYITEDDLKKLCKGSSFNSIYGFQHEDTLNAIRSGFMGSPSLTDK
jgi:hypothetical protein